MNTLRDHNRAKLEQAFLAALEAINERHGEALRRLA